MNKPKLSHNLVQVCKEVKGLMEVTYCITNEYDETLRVFYEDEADHAYNTWWMYLTEEECDLWRDYELECEVAVECAQEDLWGRINGC